MVVVVVVDPRNLHSEFDKNQVGIVLVVVVIVLLLMLFFRRISFINRFFCFRPSLNKRCIKIIRTIRGLLPIGGMKCALESYRMRG